MKKIRVLVACEESQAVTKAFRAQGAEAFSCDLQECSGGHPEWHIRDNALDAIESEEWGLIIAHPPCTYLTAAGNRWMLPEYAERYPNRLRQRAEAAEFFMRFANCNCKRFAIENPVGVMSSLWRKPDQYIQPFEHGHPWTKKTGLWLKGLPKLAPTNMVKPVWVVYAGKKYAPEHLFLGMPRKDRQKARSKTPEGVAKAMAEQWMAYILKETNGTD
jgi:hypothetical protein